MRLQVHRRDSLKGLDKENLAKLQTLEADGLIVPIVKGDVTTLPPHVKTFITKYVSNI